MSLYDPTRACRLQQAVGVKRVLRHVVMSHEEHAASLVQHEVRGPAHRCFVDHRRLVVGADGVEQRQLAHLLRHSAPDRGADRIAP